MSLIATLAPYAVAYIFLSLCGALVLGRIFATMGPADDDDLPIAAAGARPAIAQPFIERRARPRARISGPMPT